MDTGSSLPRLAQSLQKLVKESSKKHLQLRGALKDALDYLVLLQEDTKLNHAGVPVDPMELDRLANKLVVPLQLACETRVLKLMSTALDTLHKLIDYGYLRGAAKDEAHPDKKLMPRVVSVISSCFDYPDDLVQLQIIKAFLSAVASPHCAIHETSLLCAIRTCYNIFLVSRNPVNQGTAKGTLTQMLHIVFGRMELKMSPDVVIGSIDEDNISRQLADEGQMVEGKTNKPVVKGFARANSMADLKQAKLTPHEIAESIILDIVEGIETNASEEEGHFVFNDCYLIFRALCRLSMKEIPKDSTADSIDMKSKILSLELLYSVLSGAGPVFKSCDNFINTALQKYLVYSLLQNSTSSNPTVFRLSLYIFLELVSHFKDYLKNEIGVFYSSYLQILESANSTLQQKWMVVQVLLQVCKNAQALVDVFVNYDCDLDAKDIYERTTNDLSKISQGRHVVDKLNATQQEMKLKTLGLECLVTIMKSLVDWSKELRIEKAIDEAEPDQEIHSGFSTLKEQKKEEEEESKEDETKDEDEEEQEKEEENSKKDPDFQLIREQKLQLRKGLAKFKLDPKKGMRYFLEHNIVKNDPEEIAAFLRNTKGLDKVSIGLYIGQKLDFPKQVMHHYVDLFGFEDMHIDLALRKFLAAFRIPGEAQQIDRLMEKFAERYSTQNPKSPFANADAVYLLAFSIIMLATDLHSPAIKNKISKADWIKNQHNNNDGKDYEVQFLSDIFDRVAEKEITLQDDGTFDAEGELATDPRQRKNRFNKEMERTIHRAKLSIKEKAKDKGIYYRAKQIEYVRPMFEIAWGPMLAAFSVLLEESNDPEVIALCLDGFKYAIRVSCTFFMEIERRTFITALTKFTFLTNVKEMKQKNVEIIKTLIELAKTEANYIQDSWLQILTCVSHLEQLHLVGMGARVQALPSSPEDPRNKSGPSRTSFSGHRRMPSGSSFYEPNATLVANQIDVVAIDRIFTSSTQLNSNAIEHFVKCLCKVSQEEIESPNPRMSSIQKLVEVAHFNMDRIRLVWTRIWSYMADHFTRVGCHENPRIAMYATDSLRQLAMKFLEKKELANYQFQKEFLKPFELIMANTTSVKIRTLVVECLSTMVKSKAHNIKSGWKSIFVSFTIAASDHDEAIVKLAYSTVEEILEKHFDQIAESFFVDCVNCLVSYSNTHLFIETSMKAIQSIIFCSTQLAEGRVYDLQENKPDRATFTADNEQHLSSWFPILTGLSKVVSHSHIDVRTAALAALFGVLKEYGAMFDEKLWELLFRGVLLPIFDNVRYASRADLLQEDNEWLTTTCLRALDSLIELFADFFSQISFLLSDLLNLLVSCILQDNESLARIGATCFFSLGMGNGPKLNEDQWTLLCSRLSHILSSNLPRELLAIDGDLDIETSSKGKISSQPSSPRRNEISPEGPQDDSPPVTPRRSLSFKAIRGKCTVQLGLVEALNDIVFTHYTSLTTPHLVTLLDALLSCFKFFNAVNTNPLLQGQLSKTGLMDLLIKEETTSLSYYLRILFRMYGESAKNSSARTEIAEERLIGKCAEICRNYLFKGPNGVPPDDAHSLKVFIAYTQIVVQMLQGLFDFYDQQFEKHLHLFYPLLTSMIFTESKDVRQALRPFFERVGKMKLIT